MNLSKLHIKTRFYNPERYKIGFLICLGIFAAFVALSSFRQQSAEEFYKQELKGLQYEVEGISTLLGLQEESELNMELREKQLQTIVLRCGNMMTYHEQNKEAVKPEELKTRLESIDKLCTDLIAVSEYSRGVNRAISDYLTFTAKWPAVDDNTYAQSLQDVFQTIRNTKAQLNRIDNSRVQDPAMQELLIQLDKTEKLTAEIKTARDNQDYARATSLSATLVKTMEQDKAHFLAARQYFWNNTVQIEVLLQMIDKLRLEFDE